MGSNYSGDNAIIKLSDFKDKMLRSDKTFYQAMTIKKKVMWNYPDGEDDFSEYGTRLAKIFSKIDTGTGSFPFTKNNTWHDGIHLKNIEKIYSIGVGTIVAVRNIKENPLKGDSNFILMKHQVKLNNEYKQFYSLYMHLKYIDIKQAVEDFVLENKRAKYNWLNQLTKNLLPYKIIVKNLNTKNALGSNDNVEEQDGLLTGKYQNIILNNASYDKNTRIFNDLGSDSNIKVGRRILITPLPANNPKLMEMLLDPSKYDEQYFFKNMREESNYIKNNKFFFVYDGKLLCFSFNETYFEKIPFNSMEFKMCISRLHNVYSGETTFFNEEFDTGRLGKINISEDVEITAWKNENKATNKKILESNTYSFELINQRKEYFNRLDSLYFLGCYSLSDSNLTLIKNAINKYSAEYFNIWKESLFGLLEGFQSNNLGKTGGTEETAEESWKILIRKCNDIINSLSKIHGENKNQIIEEKKSGIEIVSNFKKVVDSYEYISHIEKLSIYEFLILKLFSYPAEKIKNNSNGENDSFTKNDSWYKATINEVESIFNEIRDGIKLFSRKYIDTDIEIGKREYIADCGKYELKNEFHFEILAPTEVLGLTSERQIKDTDRDSYFNPQRCISSLTPILKKNVKQLKFLDDGIITNTELQQLLQNDKDIPFLAEYGFNHISQWSKEISAPIVEKIGFFFKKRKIYIGDITINTREEKKYIDFDEYYSKYQSIYMWMDKRFFKSEKFVNGQVWVYHPLYFIEQLVK